MAGGPCVCMCVCWPNRHVLCLRPIVRGKTGVAGNDGMHKGSKAEHSSSLVFSSRREKGRSWVGEG